MSLDNLKLVRNCYVTEYGWFGLLNINECNFWGNGVSTALYYIDTQENKLALLKTFKGTSFVVEVRILGHRPWYGTINDKYLRDFARNRLLRAYTISRRNRLLDDSIRNEHSSDAYSRLDFALSADSTLMAHRVCFQNRKTGAGAETNTVVDICCISYWRRFLYL